VEESAASHQVGMEETEDPADTPAAERTAPKHGRLPLSDREVSHPPHPRSDDDMLSKASNRQASDSAALKIAARDLETLRKTGTETEKAILHAIDHSSRQVKSAIEDLANCLAPQSNQDRLAALQKWQALNRSELSEFVDNVSSDTEQRRFKQAVDFFLGGLHFNQINDRYLTIPEAHTETFRWIFKTSVPDSRYASFKDWLEELGESQQLYWITGR